jgi:hypothetical protein
LFFYMRKLKPVFMARSPVHYPVQPRSRSGLRYYPDSTEFGSSNSKKTRRSKSNGGKKGTDEKSEKKGRDHGDKFVKFQDIHHCARFLEKNGIEPKGRWPWGSQFPHEHLASLWECLNDGRGRIVVKDGKPHIETALVRIVLVDVNKRQGGTSAVRYKNTLVAPIGHVSENIKNRTRQLRHDFSGIIRLDLAESKTFCKTEVRETPWENLESHCRVVLVQIPVWSLGDSRKALNSSKVSNVEMIDFDRLGYERCKCEIK